MQSRRVSTSSCQGILYGAYRNVGNRRRGPENIAQAFCSDIFYTKMHLVNVQLRHHRRRVQAENTTTRPAIKRVRPETGRIFSMRQRALSALAANRDYQCTALLPDDSRILPLAALSARLLLRYNRQTPTCHCPSRSHHHLRLTGHRRHPTNGPYCNQHLRLRSLLSRTACSSQIKYLSRACGRLVPILLFYLSLHVGQV